MKAITVKYLPATNYRGSRLKAFDCDGNQATIGYDNEFNRDELYRKAAYALRDKMGWSGEMISGGVKGGEVFVFLPKSMNGGAK